MTSLPFDADAVRSLAMILADTGLTEIEIEGKEGRIRVVRALAPVAPPPGPPWCR
jgi:acetyl-CoA carboxylase biotin carboxyl carrier protein